MPIQLTQVGPDEFHEDICPNPSYPQFQVNFTPEDGSDSVTATGTSDGYQSPPGWWLTQTGLLTYPDDLPNGTFSGQINFCNGNQAVFRYFSGGLCQYEPVMGGISHNGTFFEGEIGSFFFQGHVGVRGNPGGSLVSPVNLIINWGDGTTTTRNNLSSNNGYILASAHNYTPGTYTITATVTLADPTIAANCPGASGSATYTFEVLPQTDGDETFYYCENNEVNSSPTEVPSVVNYNSADAAWAACYGYKGPGFYCHMNACVEVTDGDSWNTAGRPLIGPYNDENCNGECAGIPFPGDGYYCVEDECVPINNPTTWVDSGSPTPRYQTQAACSGACGGGSGQTHYYCSENTVKSSPTVVPDIANYDTADEAWAACYGYPGSGHYCVNNACVEITSGDQWNTLSRPNQGPYSQSGCAAICGGGGEECLMSLQAVDDPANDRIAVTVFDGPYNGTIITALSYPVGANPIKTGHVNNTAYFARSLGAWQFMAQYQIVDGPDCTTITSITIVPVVEPETVFWCENNTIQAGTNPPQGVTTHPTYQACWDAGCHPIEPSVYYWCVNGDVVPSATRPAPLAVGPFSSPPDCSAIVPPVEPDPNDCTYLPYALTVSRKNDVLNGDHLALSLHVQGGLGGTNNWNSGWNVVLQHFVNNEARPNVGQSGSSYPFFNYVVPAENGVHRFEAKFTKPGCIAHIADASFSVGGTTNPGGGGVDCPPCPPPAAHIDKCAPEIEFLRPEANASLANFVRVRVAVADAHEETDPCHANFHRVGNFEADRPALKLFLGEYEIPATWKRVSGTPLSPTPLNGIYETLFDSRDYSNGTHILHVSMRGVGGCRVSKTRTVVLNNTLQGNIFYRDTFADGREGFVIGDALIGIETRALEENTSRRYWMQSAVRSGTSLDGPYKHDDWPKHQPVLLQAGASFAAQGDRFQRYNYSAHVTFRLPLARQVRFRRKWTPQFYLSCFDLNAETVAKIRPIASGRHFLFTTSPARVWMYDGKEVKIYGDFSKEPTVDKDELGTNEEEDDFEFVDKAGSNIYAPNAIDCTVIGGEATGDKVYVIVPPSNDFQRGEVFAFDPDKDENAVQYGIRRENRVPRFIEAVNGRVVCLYVHDEATTLPVASKRTRAYDLTFSQPALLWQLAAPATFAGVDGDTLFVASGKKLYSTNGSAAPTLVHEFPANVSAASKTFVGLVSGQVWKKTTLGWSKVRDGNGTIGGVTSWTGGTNGEAQSGEARGVSAGTGAWLSGERQNGTWFQECELRVPINRQTKTVEGVSALDRFSVQVLGPATEDATPVAQRDERLLIGTKSSGLFFVYQRSALSEKDGAIPVSHDSVPRLFPFPRRPSAVTT